MILNILYIKVIVLGVLIGVVLQIIAYKYLEKKNPELLIDKTNDKIYSTHGIRGGALAEAVTLIVLLAEKGAWVRIKFRELALFRLARDYVRDYLLHIQIMK